MKEEEIKKENETMFDSDFVWIVILLMIFSNGSNDIATKTLENKVANIEGKMSIIEKLIK